MKEWKITAPLINPWPVYFQLSSPAVASGRESLPMITAYLLHNSFNGRLEYLVL